MGIRYICPDRMLFLDVAAGSRMMWRLKDPPGFVFMDKNPWSKIPPDVVGVWEYLPFRAGLFETAFFDPPHKFNRTSGFWADSMSSNYYGADIRREKLISGIYRGSRELLRVARRLCLKWCDDEISLQRILGLIPRQWKPINKWHDEKIRAHGNTTWWITFIQGGLNN